MKSKSILNNVSILSSHILNNVRFLKPEETESLMAETITIVSKQKFPV